MVLTWTLLAGGWTHQPIIINQEGTSSPQFSGVKMLEIFELPPPNDNYKAVHNNY